ncbi:hypothetical protein [Methylocystis sp. SC2]|uniref:hypothetical protein n=1 Tax=Methylocystis sp. (strain SC2) TaxID=187303 RepID=UPI00130D836A|nr:hypothetical protein [Methylocystis sp. SC2]
MPLRATRQRDERGEFVTSLAHAFIRTGKRIMAAQRREPIASEFDFIDRQSNRVLVHRFGEDRINAFSLARQFAHHYLLEDPKRHAWIARPDPSLEGSMPKVSAAPRAWRKDLTGDSLRQYN